MVEQALLTAIFTLVGAIILFAISEFARGLFIQPILKIRSLVGDIVDKVIYYSADLTSGAKITKKREKQIREELRALGTQLRANEHMLLLYGLWAWIRLVPSSDEIDKCAKCLTGLSNAFRLEKDRYPQTHMVADYEFSKEMIIELQNSLRLKSKIIPEIKNKK